MADKSAQKDIRGLQIEKMVRGFAEEALIFRKYLIQGKTSSREIRWYAKTAGFLDSADTSGITASHIANSAAKALPVVVEASWTRNTSHVRIYKVESPWLSTQDLKDSDVGILSTNLRDLSRAVSNLSETRCYEVVADKVTSVPGDGTSVPTAAATADGWDDTATGDPIADFLTAQGSIRSYRYEPKGCVAYMHTDDYNNLVKYLINVKGSSIPALATQLAESGVLMQLLGTKIVVSNNATTDYVLFFTPNVTASWKSFTPLQTYILDDPGIGKKIRIVEEGECIMHDPNSAYVLSSTQV